MKLKLAIESNLLDREAFPYSKLVGRLLYLSVCTRHNINQAMGFLGRYKARPSMVRHLRKAFIWPEASPRA